VSFSFVIVFIPSSIEIPTKIKFIDHFFAVLYPLRAFANLILKLVLLSWCPSQRHISDLGRVIDLV
jgi:hypothetical protein